MISLPSHQFHIRRNNRPFPSYHSKFTRSAEPLFAVNTVSILESSGRRGSDVVNLCFTSQNWPVNQRFRSHVVMPVVPSADPRIRKVVSWTALIPRTFAFSWGWEDYSGRCLSCLSPHCGLDWMMFCSRLFCLNYPVYIVLCLWCQLLRLVFWRQVVGHVIHNQEEEVMCSLHSMVVHCPERSTNLWAIVV